MAMLVNLCTEETISFVVNMFEILRLPLDYYEEVENSIISNLYHVYLLSHKKVYLTKQAKFQYRK